MSLIKLGIPVFDGLVEGVRRGSMIVFAGPPGIGKSVFVRYAVLNVLSSSGKVVYIAFDEDPGEVIAELESAGGIEPSSVRDRVLVLDGFSVRLPGLEEAGYTVVDPMNLIEALNTIYNAVKTYASEVKLLVIDSINEIILRNEPGIVLDFIKGLKALSKRYGIISIIVLHSGIPGLEQIYSTIEYVSDSFVEMGFDPSLEQLGIPLRRLRVRKLKGASHSLDWVPYTIGKGGKIMVVDIKKIMESVRTALAELKTLTTEKR